MDERTVKYYEDLTISHSNEFDTILGAINIVKKFVIREKKIIVGGLNIDYNLKLKKDPGIYDKDQIPDIDIISETHFEDAYNIAVWLKRLGYKNIGVMNALHPSTIRIKIDFITIFDATYCPKNILDNIPTLMYKGYVLSHPNYQYIDIHRSLCHPYENSPYETILYRPKKDMSRYDKLYKYYPLIAPNIKNPIIELNNIETISLKTFDKQCITGFFALNYWLIEAKKLGYSSSKYDFGSYNIIYDDENANDESPILKFQIPIDSHGITLYSDNIKDIYEIIKSNFSTTEERFYNKFLDKLPRKIILDNKWELLENNHKIAAHKASFANELKLEIHIANLQNVMMYLLINFILLTKIKDEKRGYSFYMGYLSCKELIEWASNKYYSIKPETADLQNIKDKLKQFFPTSETYGEKNMSDAYIVAKHKFDLKNKTLSVDERYKYAQPKNIYDRDLQYNKIPKKYLEFNIHNSEVFKLDGENIPNFLK